MTADRARLVQRARDAAQHSREFGPMTNAELLDELAAAIEGAGVEVALLEKDGTELRDTNIALIRRGDKAEARAERLAEALRDARRHACIKHDESQHEVVCIPPDKWAALCAALAAPSADGEATP